MHSEFFIYSHLLGLYLVQPLEVISHNILDGDGKNICYIYIYIFFLRVNFNQSLKSFKKNFFFFRIFWLIAILAFIILIFIFFFVPETYRKHKNLPPPSSNTDSSAPTKKKIINPLASLILFRYPNLPIVLSYISLFLSLIYIQAALIPREFNKIYHLSSSHTGLVFLSPAAGYMLGSVMGGRYSDYIIRDAKRTALIALRKKTENQKGNNILEGVLVVNDDENIEISKEDDILDLSLIKIEPEKRIRGTWIGAIIIPICYLAYGWLLEYKVPIVYPIVVMFFGKKKRFSCFFYLIK
jgi:hypothetical protein